MILGQLNPVVSNCKISLSNERVTVRNLSYKCGNKIWYENLMEFKNNQKSHSLSDSIVITICIYLSDIVILQKQTNQFVPIVINNNQININ